MESETAELIFTGGRVHTDDARNDESRTGSLDLGKLADLVLLEEDLARVRAAKIRHAGAVMTVVGGRVVHET